jgi:hypothetical protein
MSTFIKQKDIFQISEDRVRSGFNGSTVLIPHVCNNIGLFGAGFAAHIRKRYPIVATNFELLGNKTKLGYVQYVEVLKNPPYNHKLIFANMICQNRIRSANNPRPLNYEFLVQCMVDVRKFLSTLETENKEIHCPRFGSGLAGGNWNLIENLIEDIWTKFNIYIYLK